MKLRRSIYARPTLFNFIGRDSATAGAIFAKMDFQENDLDWNNCIGVSVDNTSVNLEKNNSHVKGKILPHIS